LYEYTNANPIIRLDPYGKDWWPWNDNPSDDVDWFDTTLRNGTKAGHCMVVVGVGGIAAIKCGPVILKSGGTAARCCSPALRQAASNAARQLPRLERLAAQRLQAIRRAQQSGNTQNLERLIRQYDDIMERIWHAKGLIEKALSCF